MFMFMLSPDSVLTLPIAGNPAALPLYSKYISIAFSSLKVLFAVFGLIASIIVRITLSSCRHLPTPPLNISTQSQGSYRLLYYFIVPYRAILVLTLAKSLALPIVLYLRREPITSACTQWTTDNPAEAPQKPDCGTATNFAIAFLAIWASIEFLFEVCFFCLNTTLFSFFCFYII